MLADVRARRLRRFPLRVVLSCRRRRRLRDRVSSTRAATRVSGGGGYSTSRPGSFRAEHLSLRCSRQYSALHKPLRLYRIRLDRSCIPGALPSWTAPFRSAPKRTIDGQERVHYYGYWVKTYPVPADTLYAKKELIAALTRRLFNHTETPVERAGYSPRRSAPRLLRGNGSTAPPRQGRDAGGRVVQPCHGHLHPSWWRSRRSASRSCPTMPSCSSAGNICRKHWNSASWCCTVAAKKASTSCGASPSRRSCCPSRISTRAATSRSRKRCGTSTVSPTLVTTFVDLTPSPASRRAVGVRAGGEDQERDPAHRFGHLRRMDHVRRVRRAPVRVRAELVREAAPRAHQEVADARRLIAQGKDLITYITRARVPMPKSTREFIERCERFRGWCTALLPGTRKRCTDRPPWCRVERAATQPPSSGCAAATRTVRNNDTSRSMPARSRAADVARQTLEHILAYVRGADTES